MFKNSHDTLLTYPPQADNVAPCDMANTSEVIEKLLILQDRDRKLIRVRQELAYLPLERQQLTGKASSSQTALDAARHRAQQLEADRKRLELEVEACKQKIDKYTGQQFLTRKNDEFRALGKEIDTTKKEMFEIENQILENMESSEGAQKDIAAAAKVAAEAKKIADEQVAVLNAREKNLQGELAAVEAERAKLAGEVDEMVLGRYERLLKSKGDSVVVGIERGVCRGCHMRLSRQIVVSCRAQQEIINCVNCGRILYYSPEMDISVEE